MLNYPYLHETRAQNELGQVIQQLELCSLSQIFAFRRTLNSYTEAEIECAYHKHRDQYRSATSLLCSQPVLGDRSSFASSINTNRTSYASSGNSRLSTTSDSAGTPFFGGPVPINLDMGEVYPSCLSEPHGGNSTQQCQENMLTAPDYKSDAGYAGIVPPNSYHTHPQEGKHVISNALPQGLTRHFSTTVKPFIPCPDPSCPAMYTKIFELTKHIKSCHARDRTFVCLHSGCVNTTYVDSEAKRHHAIHHKACSNDPVNCRDSHILHIKKVWGCGVCLFTLLSEDAWVEHYSSHFANRELTKNDVDFSQTIRSLLNQDLTRSFWNKAIEGHAPYLKYSWKEDQPGVRDLLFGLEYGIYKERKLENDPNACSAIVKAAYDLVRITA